MLCFTEKAVYGDITSSGPATAMHLPISISSRAVGDMGISQSALAGESSPDTSIATFQTSEVRYRRRCSSFPIFRYFTYSLQSYSAFITLPKLLYSLNW